MTNHTYCLQYKVKDIVIVSLCLDGAEKEEKGDRMPEGQMEINSHHEKPPPTTASESCIGCLGRTVSVSTPLTSCQGLPKKHYWCI